VLLLEDADDKKALYEGVKVLEKLTDNIQSLKKDSTQTVSL